MTFDISAWWWIEESWAEERLTYCQKLASSVRVLG